jgi:hypothetical protein
MTFDQEGIDLYHKTRGLDFCRHFKKWQAKGIKELFWPVSPRGELHVHLKVKMNNTRTLEVMKYG